MNIYRNISRCRLTCATSNLGSFHKQCGITCNGFFSSTTRQSNRYSSSDLSRNSIGYCSRLSLSNLFISSRCSSITKVPCVCSTLEFGSITGTRICLKLPSNRTTLINSSHFRSTATQTSYRLTCNTRRGFF